MAKWAKKLSLLLLLYSLSISGFSQIENEKNIDFFNYLYNFNFESADSIISTIDSTEESSNFNFLKAHYMRWYHLPIHNQNDSILSAYKKYLAISEGFGNFNSVNYTKINNSLLSAEYNYNQGNYYRAFQNGSYIYDNLKDKLDTEPKEVQLKFLSSLYHYYYQYYKTENSVFGAMLWVFKEGNKETGLKWLEEVAEQESIVKPEALIYLSHIYLRLENNPEKAYHYALMLHQLYPDNLKFYELLIESAIACKDYNPYYFQLANKLIMSEKIYFKKYGLTYKCLLDITKEEIKGDQKLYLIDSAYSFVERNGGGNHLQSLLLKAKLDKTADSMIRAELERKLENKRVYLNCLTATDDF